MRSSWPGLSSKQSSSQTEPSKKAVRKPTGMLTTKSANRLPVLRSRASCSSLLMALESLNHPRARETRPMSQLSPSPRDHTAPGIEAHPAHSALSVPFTIGAHPVHSALTVPLTLLGNQGTHHFQNTKGTSSSPIASKGHLRPPQEKQG